jgi:hypothetical protein
MGWECSTHEGEDRRTEGFDGETFNNNRKIPVEATIIDELCSLYLSRLSSQQTLYWEVAMHLVTQPNIKSCVDTAGNNQCLCHKMTTVIFWNSFSCKTGEKTLTENRQK